MGLKLVSFAVENIFNGQDALAELAEVIEIWLIVLQIEIAVFFQSFLSQHVTPLLTGGSAKSLNRFTSLFVILVQSLIEVFVHLMNLKI